MCPMVGVVESVAALFFKSKSKLGVLHGRLVDELELKQLGFIGKMLRL